MRGAPFLKTITTNLCALLVLAGATPSVARAANEKEACVHAVDRAQVARLDGKLREAREGLLTCARPVCPSAIRADCTRWLAEVEASLPSVVIEAVWADGHPVTAVSVTLDGEPLPEPGDGHTVTLDPGAHTFRFEVAGASPVELRNVVHEGERNRVIHVTLTPIAPLSLAPPPPAAPAPEPTLRYTPMPPAMWQPSAAETSEGSPARGPIPAPAYVLGGFALVGFGGFAYFGLAGTNRLDTLRSTCVHTCSPSDVTSARSEILVGDVLGLAALAATGVATLLVLTRPRVSAHH